MLHVETLGLICWVFQAEAQKGPGLEGACPALPRPANRQGGLCRGRGGPGIKNHHHPAPCCPWLRCIFFFFFRVRGRRPCVRSAQPHAHAHLPILYLVTVPKASTLVSPSESCAHLSLTGPNTRDLGPHLRQQSRCRHVKRESLETDWVSQALVQFNPAPHLYF